MNKKLMILCCAYFASIASVSWSASWNDSNTAIKGPIVINNGIKLNLGSYLENKNNEPAKEDNTTPKTTTKGRGLCGAYLGDVSDYRNELKTHRQLVQRNKDKLLYENVASIPNDDYVPCAVRDGNKTFRHFNTVKVKVTPETKRIFAISASEKVFVNPDKNKTGYSAEDAKNEFDTISKIIEQQYNIIGEEIKKVRDNSVSHITEKPKRRKVFRINNKTTMTLEEYSVNPNAISMDLETGQKGDFKELSLVLTDENLKEESQKEREKLIKQIEEKNNKQNNSTLGLD